jgi:C1A family cysteine protease
VKHPPDENRDYEDCRPLRLRPSRDAIRCNGIDFHSFYFARNLSESVAMPIQRHLLARDVKDDRDYFYTLPRHHAHEALPKRVDLRAKCSPVWNQGSIGTCTAHAVAAAFAYEQRLQGMRVIRPSRLFIFYNERALTGQRGMTPVLYLRDALKAVAKRGVCHEKLWPYTEDPKTVKAKPPKHAFAAATKKRVFEYHRIRHSQQQSVFLKQLKRCLADGSPVVFGMEVYASFETHTVIKSGIMPFPDPQREEFRGGHAVMAVGYDDRRRAVLVRNSWGPKWGQKGYFWMPYKIVTDRKLTHDFWTIRGVAG